MKTAENTVSHGPLRGPQGILVFIIAKIYIIITVIVVIIDLKIGPNITNNKVNMEPIKNIFVCRHTSF